METNKGFEPIFNIIESKKPTPLDRLASLREAQIQLGIQGMEEQRQGIAETKAQLQALEKNAPDAKKQKMTMALLAAGDILGNTGGKASQLYQMFQPKDTTKQQTALQKLLAQQRQGLSKSELGLLDQQLTSQYQDAQLDLLGQKVAQKGKGDPLKDLKTTLDIKKIQGQLDKEASEKEAKKKAVTNVGQVLIRDIGMAKDLIDKGGYMTTTLGGLPGLIPGTDANVMRKHIKSVKGNIAVDQLLEIKRQGSGLGQVPQSQLDMLSTLMGSLEADLPPDILKSNLEDIENIYADIVKKEGGDPFELANKRKKGAAPATPPPTFKSEKANELFKKYGG